jgi:hypothetical protein
MTPMEFKAWFDGFTESIDKTPTQKQWARIKERVGEIDGKPTTERVYIDRYIDRYWPRYISSGIALCSNATTSVARASTEDFNSMSAMNMLGKAEAANIN